MVSRPRARERHPSPRSVRRHSRDSLTPPTSPTSPTSVLPSTAASWKSAASSQKGLSPAARSLCSPASLLRPLQLFTPPRPPGFDASPTAATATPSFVPANPTARTPSSSPRADSVGSARGLEPLFARASSPLLSRPPSSPPPRRPTARRKTLAIHRTGFSVRRSSTRIKEKRRAKTIAKEAEAFVCRNLGIIKDGEVVTEQALDEFARIFKGQASDDAIRALRLLFKLDGTQELAVESAMLNRGGATALEQFAAPGDHDLTNA